MTSGQQVFLNRLEAISSTSPVSWVVYSYDALYLSTHPWPGTSSGMISPSSVLHRDVIALHLSGNPNLNSCFLPWLAAMIQVGVLWRDTDELSSLHLVIFDLKNNAASIILFCNLGYFKQEFEKCNQYIELCLLSLVHLENFLCMFSRDISMHDCFPLVLHNKNQWTWWER